MKISPVSAQGTTIGAISADAPATMASKIRSLKMNTNATPGRVEEPPLPPESTILDDNKDTAEVVTEETQPLSPQFAALAKQRRALQVKERELADREKALVDQSAMKADSVEKARLKSDPLGVLLDAGVTYDQLTEAVLANQNGYNPEIKKLKDELAALRDGVDKKLTDRDSQAEQAALAEMRREGAHLIATGDEFQMIRETKRLDDVMRLIEKIYRETGEVIHVREGCELVEAELVKEGLQLAGFSKVQSQIAPQAPVLEAPPQQQRQMRTLTNRDTASVPLSRKARALAAFNGTLKK